MSSSSDGSSGSALARGSTSEGAADKAAKDPAAPPAVKASKAGGRLWQNGRFSRSYDRLGPCLGSGGMGSVWAARVSGDGDSSGSAGTWVAVKAIPFELGKDGTSEDGGPHSGLRECLSTFRDLSPVYVVRYETYWLEEPDGLPPDVLHYSEQRLGRRLRPRAREGSICAAPSVPEKLATVHRSPSGESAVTGYGSLRFRENLEGGFAGFGSSIGDRCRWPSSPSERYPVGESCGFIWENSGTGGSASPDETPVDSPIVTPREDVRGKRLGSVCMNALASSAGVPLAPAPACAVLFIEMELMGGQPDAVQCPGAAKEERLTLRTWLQRRSRTLMDAADVFGAMMLSVRHIHRKRIVHADLKPDNLFCVAERSRITAVRIGDFGLAGENQQDRQVTYGAFRSTRIMGGTPGYVAPEILRAERERNTEVCHSEKVDIFACAVILLELLLTPFRTQMERAQVLDAFRSEKDARNRVPDYICTRLPKCQKLLKEMSEHDPAARLSAEEVCKRIEKEVRKELCRSSVQQCCEPALPDCNSRLKEPSVQVGREAPKEKERVAGPQGGGHRRKGGKRPGRKGG